MSYFTQDYLDFFTELEQNNHKDWFDENRKRYEKTVKVPVRNFVTDLIKAIQEKDAEIDLEAKDCVFRINRDIRFSKDKTPYKIHSSAAIAKGGRKDYSNPGLYTQFNHVDLRIYTGVYSLDKKQLESVRDYILDYSDELNAIVDNKAFKKVFGEVLGDKNKRIPKFYQEAAESQPFLYNKSFYVFTKWKPEVILDNNLIDIIMEAYEVSHDFRMYFKEALDVN